MVVRVEDLVRWSCRQPAGWSLMSMHCGTNGLHKPAQSGNGSGSTTVNRKRELLEDEPKSKTSHLT